MDGGISGEISGTHQKQKPVHIGRTQRSSVKGLGDLLHSEESKEPSSIIRSTVK